MNLTNLTNITNNQDPIYIFTNYANIILPIFGFIVGVILVTIACLKK